MALVHDDRIKETSTTILTATYVLLGAVTGFQSFAAIGNGNTCYYCATDGTDWEVGIGTYTLAGTTLARTSILSSSNADAAVSWGAGTRTLFVTPAASKFLGKDDILAYLLTIDGSGSGLDADLLDGNSSAFFAPIASPTLTGVPAAPTAALGTNTTQLATTAFVQAQGWTLVTSQQPTSDVTTVTFTGLSGYRHIKIVGIYNSTGNDVSPTLAISCRVSAGTYRDFLARTVGSSANNLKVVMAIIEITNFGGTDTFKIIEHRSGSVAATTLDNTNDVQDTIVAAVYGSGLVLGYSMASYQESWDDVKLTASVGIEGSTAGQRGYFYVFGRV